LALALDEWAALETDEGRRRSLGRLAGKIDPDEWRIGLRSLLVKPDRRQLIHLAESANIDALAPQSAVLLGRALHRAGAYNEAAALMKRCQWRHPADYWVNRELAYLLTETSPPNNGEAIRYFHAALAAGGPDPVDLRELGYAYFANGENGSAAEAVRQAIRQRPDYALGYRSLGAVLEATADMDEALESTKTACRLEPNDGRTWCNYGTALRHYGRYGEAIETLQKAIALDPEYPESYCVLGDCFERTGRFREALDAYRKGLALGTKRRYWQFPTAEEVKRAERLVGLEGRLGAVVKVAPDASPQELLDLAMMCTARKRNSEAVELFRQAFSGEPNLALYKKDFELEPRLEAARAAALASTGVNTSPLDDAQRAALARQAVDWLTKGLDYWEQQMPPVSPGQKISSDDKAAIERQVYDVKRAMRVWQRYEGLEGIRDAKWLSRLPAKEREMCERLWDRVRLTCERAIERAPQFK
jgi:tetratricopeptide (TPR) repeat protein